MLLTGKIQVLILLYIQAKGISSSNKCEDINLENFCRYKVQIHPLTWEDAHRVCLAMNRTLLQIVDKDTLESVIKYASKCVYPRISNLNSKLWVGIRAKLEDGIVKHYWENCDVIDETRDVRWHSNDDTKPGCVAVKKSNENYHVEACSQLYPYICEAKNTTPCFDEVRWKGKMVFSNFKTTGEFNDCDEKKCKNNCRSDKDCIGFQMDGAICKIQQYDKDHSTGAGLNERNPAFTMGNIGFETYTQMTSSDQSASEFCFQTTDASSPNDITPTVESKTTELTEGVTSALTMAESDSSVYSLSSDITNSYSSSTSELQLSSGTIRTSPISEEMTSGDTSYTKGTEALIQPTSTEAGDITTDLSNTYTSSINSTGCMCPCSMYRNTSYSPEELKSRLEEIKEKLTVDRKKTSSYQRSLFSAPDDRISARRIGYVGVVIMAVICVLVVLMDVPRCISSLRDFINNCR